jgi:hypothetical protein
VPRLETAFADSPPIPEPGAEHQLLQHLQEMSAHTVELVSAWQETHLIGGWS